MNIVLPTKKLRYVGLRNAETTKVTVQMLRTYDAVHFRHVFLCRYLTVAREMDLADIRMSLYDHFPRS